MILNTGLGHLIFSTTVGFAINLGAEDEDVILKDKYLLLEILEFLKNTFATSTLDVFAQFWLL